MPGNAAAGKAWRVNLGFLILRGRQAFQSAWKINLSTDGIFYGVLETGSKKES